MREDLAPRVKHEVREVETQNREKGNAVVRNVAGRWGSSEQTTLRRKASFLKPNLFISERRKSEFRNSNIWHY